MSTIRIDNETHVRVKRIKYDLELDDGINVTISDVCRIVLYTLTDDEIKNLIREAVIEA